MATRFWHHEHPYYDDYERTKAGGVMYSWFTPVAAAILSILLSILVIARAV
jgi:hypothetical protein